MSSFFLRKCHTKTFKLQGWFHGFFQEKDTVIALIELAGGEIVKEYADEIVFDTTYGQLLKMTKSRSHTNNDS